MFMEQLFNYEQLLVTVTVTQVKYLSDLSDYAVTLTNYSITADNSISIWDFKNSTLLHQNIPQSQNNNGIYTEKDWTSS